jgi:hypothetical protein
MWVRNWEYIRVHRRFVRRWEDEDWFAGSGFRCTKHGMELVVYVFDCDSISRRGVPRRFDNRNVRSVLVKPEIELQLSLFGRAA